MPEGDTVRRLADRIGARFAGERCTRSIARDPRITHLDLAGAQLLEADAVGKWLLLRFDDDRTVYGHLRMDGRWDLGRRSAAPEWQRRLEVEFESGWMTAVDMPRDRRRRHARRGVGGRTSRARPVRPGRARHRGDRRPTRRAAGARRSPAPSSTSATWPASATSTRSRRRSSPACRRSSPSGRSTDSIWSCAPAAR